MSGSRGGGYSFRISVEGMQEFARLMNQASLESDRAQQAFGRLIQASPQLASALTRAEDATKRAADRAKELREAQDRAAQSAAALPSSIARLGESFQVAQGRAQVFRSGLYSLSEVMTRLGGAGVGGAVGQVASGVATLSDLFGTAANASTRFESGLAAVTPRLLTIAGLVALPALLQSVGLGISTAGQSSAQASSSMEGLQRTLDGVNERLLTTKDRAVLAARALRTTAIAAAEASVGGALIARGDELGRIMDLDPRIARQQRALEEAEAAAGRARQDVQAAGLNPISRNPLLGGASLAQAERAVANARAELERLQTERRQLANLIEQRGENAAIAERERQRLLGSPLDLPTGGNKPGGGGGGSDGPDSITRMVQRNAERARQEEQRARERANELIAQDERRLLEVRERQNERTTDSIVNYAAERFADLFSDTGRGFAGLMESIRRTAIATFARISAEAVIRPIVAPVVSALGLGGLTGGDGAGGGGLGLGGIAQALGLGSSINSLTGGGLTSWLGLGSGGISGLLSAPLWGNSVAGAGMFAEASAASMGLSGSQAAGLAGLGPSLGSLLGAAGLGALGGGLIANFTGGNPIGGSVGGGLGAAAGLALAPFLGPLAPFAPFLGGALGGGLGGLFGNSGPAFSGGDALVGRTDDGLLTVTGFAGKGYDGAQLTEQTRQQVAQLNARLQAAGLRATSGMRANVGGGESPNPTTLAGALDKFGFGYTAADSRIQTALNLRAPQGVEETLAVAEQAQALITALGSIQAPASEFGQRLQAINAQFGPLVQSARDLGFGLEEATAAQQRALDDLWGARVEAFAGIKTGLSIREARARGDTTGAALMEFDYAAAQAVTALEQQLESLAITADDSAEAIGRLRAVQDQERAALQRANASGAQQLLESLTFGGDSLLSPAARGQAALSAFNTARSGVAGGQGIEEFLRVAGTALPVLRDYLGPSERFAGVLSATASTLSGVAGADPAQLARLLEAQAYGQDRVAEAVFAAGFDTVAAIEALRMEFRDYAGRVDAVLRRYVN